MLLKEIVKLQKLDDIVAEFEKVVKDYKSQWPQFEKDNEKLKQTLDLFKAGKFKEALKIIDSADTIVRDHVPSDVWEILDNAK